MLGLFSSRQEKLEKQLDSILERLSAKEIMIAKAQSDFHAALQKICNNEKTKPTTKRQFIELYLKKWPGKRDKNNMINLCGLSLEEVDLKKIDLSCCDLKKTNLENARLFSSNLSGSDLSSANFTNSFLFAADLSGCIFNEETKLQGANLQKVIFGKKENDTIITTDLAKINFSGVEDLSGSCFQYCDLTEVKTLKGKNLAGADFSNAIINGCDLTNTNLKSVTFTVAAKNDSPTPEETKVLPSSFSEFGLCESETCSSSSPLLSLSTTKTDGTQLPKSTSSDTGWEELRLSTLTRNRANKQRQKYIVPPEAETMTEPQTSFANQKKSFANEGFTSLAPQVKVRE